MKNCGCIAICLLALSSWAAADETIAILPPAIELFGPESRQLLLVERLDGVRALGQVTDTPVFTSSDENVVRVESGRAVPVGNGTATLTVQVGQQSAQANVVVAKMDTPWEWSFRNHVMPVLSKTGCNSGACHGALAGKGGFKLTLHGYDAAIDFHNITRQARGRRVELADPAKSLLLMKPTAAVPHKGGVRFDVSSPEYKVLSEWIAHGAAAPRPDDALLAKLTILPEGVTLTKGQTQQFVVLATYTDGRTEDVTRWVKYSSTNEAVCQVNDQGQVSVIGHGEGAVNAWFSSQIVIARVTSPYPNNVPPEVYADAPQRNFIDEHVLRKLRGLGLKPSPPASDSDFLRRAFIDTIGTMPTAAETRAFLADTAPDKRDKLIEALLARPEFADYWTYRWSDVLVINGQRLRQPAVKAYYDWVHKHVAANTPWDQFVREILTAQGNSLENGATNFYALNQDPETMAENACQAFLGLSIGCAKCHNHPLEKWTNNQYYGMANLFARVRAKGWGGDFRSGDGNRTLFVVADGELIQPLTGKPQPPTPLDGEPLTFEDTADRRIHLANWMTSPENPYFTRAIVNRVWASFMGVGLVESVDDLRVSNPASNEELLSALSQRLIEHKYDLKALMRDILQSATYQTSSQTLPENEADKRFYSHYMPRRMMAEVLLDAISQVSGVSSDFNEIGFPGADKEKTDAYPKGTRAIQLRDAAVVSYFLKAFGRNQRQITCECERSDEPSMVQVLHIANGETVNQKLKVEDNVIGQQLKANIPIEQILDELYLAALSRFPTEHEKAATLAVIAEAGDEKRREVLEDIYWSVLSSREFLFSH